MNFNKLFNLAKEKGIEDIQVLYSTNKSTVVSFQDKEMTDFTINSNNKLSVKGLYNGKMGYYSTEVVSEKEFDTIVDTIINSAKYITSEDEEFIYEGDKHYKKIPGEFNKDILNIPTKDKIELTKSISLGLLEKEGVVHAQAEYFEEESEVLMVNSKGLKIKEHSNGLGAYAYAIVSNGNDTRVGSEVYTTSNFNEFDKENLINSAYEKAFSSLGAKPVKSGKYDIVFSEGATNTLVNVFNGILSAERVQKNLSILRGRVGEKIASSKVTLVDDPFLKGSQRSRSFDSDGVATKYKELIKNGVLQGFIYSLKTAKKDNTVSTGNADGFVNCYIKPGKKTKEELIKSLKNGLYIESLQGAHAGANPMSCDFSLQATGYKVENGEIVSPVALITVAGNFLEVLANTTDVSNKLKNYIESPCIKVKHMDVSGI